MNGSTRHTGDSSTARRGKLVTFITARGKFGECELWLMKNVDGTGAREIHEVDENSDIVFPSNWLHGGTRLIIGTEQGLASVESTYEVLSLLDGSSKVILRSSAASACGLGSTDALEQVWVDFQCYRLLDDAYCHNQFAPVIRSHDHTLEALEDAFAHSHPLPHLQEWVMRQPSLAFHTQAYRLYFFIFNWRRHSIEGQHAYDTAHGQSRNPVTRTDMRKDISREQRGLNLDPAIAPLAYVFHRGKKDLQRLSPQLFGNDFLVARVRVQSIPARRCSIGNRFRKQNRRRLK